MLCRVYAGSYCRTTGDILADPLEMKAFRHFQRICEDFLLIYIWIIIHSASADATADLSAETPENTFTKLKILLKHSRMI